MARTRTKSPRARTDSSADQIQAAWHAMEEPIRQTGELIQALMMIGYGLEFILCEDASQPVLAVAGALSEKMDTIRNLWRTIQTKAR